MRVTRHQSHSGELNLPDPCLTDGFQDRLQLRLRYEGSWGVVALFTSIDWPDVFQCFPSDFNVCMEILHN
jgi:hypothetical protein